MLRTVSICSLTRHSCHRRPWLLGLILGCGLICPAWAQVVIGPANQNWASADAPVQIPAVLYEHRIVFDPFSDSSVPAAYRASRVTVDMGQAQVSTAGSVTVTLSNNSSLMITTIRVEIWDTRNAQARGVRLFHFYRDSPLITMTEPMETWGAINKAFINPVTSHAYYRRVDGSFVYIINRNPVVTEFEFVSQPGTAYLYPDQCGPFPEYDCKALRIFPQAYGDYVIRFRLKNRHGLTPNSEGYWVTWTHHVTPSLDPH